MVLLVRRNPFTRRAAVFAALLFLVAVSVAYPVQRYVQQRQHIDELRESVAAGVAGLESLQQESELRSQPFWIERQARLRLHYVRPGEAAYRVADLPADPDLPGERVIATPTSWWGRVADSLVAASTPVQAPPLGVRTPAAP